MPKTLCLSGWAQPHNALAELLPEAEHLDYHACETDAEVMALLTKHVSPEHAVVGWSMGGVLLKQAISEGYIAPSKLILIAAPAQFVACEDFPHGMDRLTFELFHQNYGTQPQRTAGRFAGLMAKGDAQVRSVREVIGQQDMAHDARAAYWHRWLEHLQETRHDAYDFSRFPPTLLLHGKGDAIVDYAQSEWLAARLSDAKLVTFEEAGHAPHWHNAAEVRAHIAEFLQE